MIYFFGVIAVIEIYYWCIWLPRNWRTNKECLDIVYGVKLAKQFYF